MGKERSSFFPAPFVLTANVLNLVTLYIKDL